MTNLVNRFYALAILLSVALLVPANMLDFDEQKNQISTELSKANYTQKARTMFKDKCKEIVGEDKADNAIENIEEGASTAFKCLSEIINMTAIQLEIDKARPNGDLDTVFQKYCERRPEVENCLNSLVNKVEPCLDAEEKDNISTLTGLFKKLLEFVCYKGGDQIALFIAEKGPECLEAKKDHLMTCLNSTMGEYFPDTNLDELEKIPKLVIGKEQCKSMHELGECVVTEMESCSEITPANIAESMFRFLKNGTICRDVVFTAHQKSAGSIGVANFALVLGLLMLAIRRNYFS